MCGICGIFSRSGSPINREILKEMNLTINHRGPDGSGYFVKKSIGLGHRRLSIIDIDGGAQPMGNEDNSLQIVFNGEIYNYLEIRDLLISFGHIFKSRSDTEVIIHAYEQWGFDCVKRFNGMFAFAIWDSKNQSLFLARDHLGIKPLYFANLGRQFIFGSEIKSLLHFPGCPREVDIDSLTELFTFRFVPSPKTLFNSIYKLEPGHYMLVTAKSHITKRFWNSIPEIRSKWNESDLISEYQSLLEDSIRIQMRSDVPVGLFLSSGIDSGTLLAIMNNYNSSPIQTFTIGFEGGEKTNEVEDAQNLASRFGANHKYLIIKPGDYLAYYKSYLWDIEEPVGHEAAGAFYFLSKLASEHVKVALMGQGADEPWAGYHRYLGIKLSKLYSRLPSLVTSGLANIVQRVPGRLERLKRGVTSLAEPDLLARLTKIYSFFNSDMKMQLFNKNIKNHSSDIGFLNTNPLSGLQKDVRHLDPLTQMLYIDTRASLPDDLLMVGDKTSMANSLEARVPYLDYRLIEFVESLPPQLKLNGITGKYLHKKALAKWLPKNIIQKKKKGFDNPIEKWLRTSMRSFVGEYLLSPNSAASIYFDQAYISQMLNRDRTGREQLRRHIYLLISFELWHRTFISNNL